MDDFDSPDMLKAIEELERKNYPAALALLWPLADAGNPRAQCNLADLYSLGWGVEADGQKAVELYLKVAEQNIREQHLSALAYHSLATLYITGVSGGRTRSCEGSKVRKACSRARLRHVESHGFLFVAQRAITKTTAYAR
jgi:uncharacterized protein